MLKPASFTALAAFVLIAAAASAAPSDNLLANPGFESGDASGWSSLGGDIAVNQPGDTGLWGARLSSDGLSTVSRIWQLVTVEPLASYRFSGSVRLADSNVDRVVFRIQWLNSAGSVIAEEESPWLQYGLAGPDSYTTGSTNSVPAPSSASAARLSAFVYGVDGDPFYALFDDFALVQTATPPPTPTPMVSQPAAPSATATPRPTSIPTPLPTARPTRTPAPSAEATAGPSGEPVVFNELTNGGFEQAGEAGIYGWRKIGGTLAQASDRKHSGDWAAALTSDTASTKWLYQTVAVEGGAYYRASAYALQVNDSPGDLFVRLSWYSSSDGSGESISSDDSSTTVSDSSSTFSGISTDAVQAPIEARSVRVRLMFRPAGPGTATAVFDDVTFGRVNPPIAHPRVAALSSAENGGTEPERPAHSSFADATAGALYNGSGSRINDGALQQAGTGGSQWLLWLALALPAFGISGLLAIPYARRRLGSGAA